MLKYSEMPFKIMVLSANSLSTALIFKMPWLLMCH